MFTIQEVADFLRVSKATVYRLVETGKINHRKIGGQVRFMKSDIANYLGCSVEEISF